MNLEQVSLEQLHGQLRSGALSASQIYGHCADLYAQREPKLQAYKTWDDAGARVTADLADRMLARGMDTGLLMGIPVSVKDLYAVRGMPTFAGSSQELGPAWQQPGPLIAGLEQQLAVFTGKTHTVEFAFGGIGTNAHWGTPRNPWSQEHRVPGGSSSGAGVSLCQGSALLALGTDTAGSVRIPASFTGNTALKTTYGRWPSEAIVPLSSSLDTPGILARSVQDLVFGFRAVESGLLGFEPEIPEIGSASCARLGRVDDFFLADASPGVLQCYEHALQKLARAGMSLAAAELPGCAPAYDIFRQGGLAAPELCAFLQAQLPGRIERLDPMVRLRVEGANELSSVDYLLRAHSLKRAALQALPAFEKHDVLLTPTIACAAPLLADLQELRAYGSANMLVLRNTSIANLLGLCAVSLPIGLDDLGLPVGLQLMAAPMAEEKLLAIALQIESILGTPAQLLGRPGFLS